MLAEPLLALALTSRDGRSRWAGRCQCVGWLSPFSRLTDSSPFLSSGLRFKFVAMSSQHLWPAGRIIATLFSPFGPAMGARLVNWARHSRLVGPVPRYLFPEEEGPRPKQRDGDPQVGLDAESIVLLRGALLDAVQGGLRAAGIDSELTAEIRRQNALLQQLVDALQGMREGATNRHVDTYTVTSTITRAH